MKLTNSARNPGVIAQLYACCAGNSLGSYLEAARRVDEKVGGGSGTV